MLYLYCLMMIVVPIHAFIPHPIIANGALAGHSTTHAEITEMALIRSVARYLYDTRIRSRNINGTIIKEQDYFTVEHTIDDLFELAYPYLSELDASLQALPLKYTIDSIMVQNVLMDFNHATNRLSAAHFDNEAFVNASRRILQARQTIVNQTRLSNQDLTKARELLGQLFHTLQDFYSHSNWIEMGRTDVNQLIGLNETIGTYAASNQSTCTSDGCTRIEKPCTLWQQISLGTCPLVYYDCQNNILPEINQQQILTSGYAANDLSESNQVLVKPTDVQKCSHGSVLDASSHIPALGGINKDSDSLVFSPHSNLHKQAANLAIKATEHFLNTLRQDIGDDNFNRLLLIDPNELERQLALSAFAEGKRFRFFTPHLSASLQKDNRLSTTLKNFLKKILRLFKFVWSGRVFTEGSMNQPTYDLSDQGVDVKNQDNFRAAPYILGKEEP